LWNKHVIGIFEKKLRPIAIGPYTNSRQGLAVRSNTVSARSGGENKAKERNQIPHELVSNEFCISAIRKTPAARVQPWARILKS
jgi:hypothetical protein